MVKGAVEVFQELKQIDSKRQDVVLPTAPLSTRRLLNQSIPTHSATQHDHHSLQPLVVVLRRAVTSLLCHAKLRLRVIVALLDGRVLLHLSFTWL